MLQMSGEHVNVYLEPCRYWLGKMRIYQLLGGRWARPSELMAAWLVSVFEVLLIFHCDTEPIMWMNQQAETLDEAVCNVCKLLPNTLTKVKFGPDAARSLCFLSLPSMIRCLLLFQILLNSFRGFTKGLGLFTGTEFVRPLVRYFRCLNIIESSVWLGAGSCGGEGCWKWGPCRSSACSAAMDLWFLTLLCLLERAV